MSKTIMREKITRKDFFAIFLATGWNYDVYGISISHHIVYSYMKESIVIAIMWQNY